MPFKTLTLRCIAAALLASRASALVWSKTPCPLAQSTMNATCDEPAHPVDRAVTLFFQVETRSGGASFACTSGEVVLCARSWAQPQSGASGSCFFLVPAGATWTCTSSGSGVNVIDASSTPLVAGALAGGAPSTLACPSGTLTAGAASASCTTAAPADAWVHVAYSGASSGKNAFTCTSGGATVCSFSTSTVDDGGARDAGSCSFLVAKGAALSCAASAGAVAFSQTYATALAGAPYATTSRAASPPCPVAGYPHTNMCDCTYVPPSSGATDTVVVIAATSVDAGFNSFHCGYDGVNTCAWGSNVGMNSSAGSCTFIMPPRDDGYICEMEWGAASFTATSLTTTLGSLFPPSSAPPHAARGAQRTRGAAAAPATEDARLARLWAAWRAEHSVAYASPAEEAARFDAFAQHVAVADAAAAHALDAPHLDAQGRPTRFNRHADLTRAEWTARYRGRAAPLPAALRRGAAAAGPSPSPSPPPPPRALDWRDKGVVSAVKDQGQCGSCWSFSTTESIESAWAIAGNPLVPLSEQALVSCDNTSYGCDGGWPYSAIDYVAEHGAVTEASWPYSSGGGTAPPCSTAGHVQAAVNVTGWRLVPGNTSAATEAALAAWLAAYGPVSILVDAMTQLWWPYTGGIMTGCCDVSSDHAVVLVGFNFTGPTPYWIIRNSWGADWGEGGFVRLAAGSNECGIGTQPIIPTVAGGALPPPPPPPPPRPVWECPYDAIATNTSTVATCVWYNNTFGQVWPTAVTEYCDYIGDGYIGYSWPMTEDPTQSDFPCAPSFYPTGNGENEFSCLLGKGENGFTGFPVGASALCGNLSRGTIGYAWPV